ncbi:MAG: pirin family protein [Myxococcaceae bacterium]|nr:pirin family protein [Myxococcaceae bacterium]
MTAAPEMPRAVIGTQPLGFMWPTLDPFLFCVHHDDHYPAGNDRLGPDAPLTGRNLGQDFEPKDGWRMYHGSVVPGFPSHPHRGFETVTIVRKGLIDHSDSLGAAARYGGGDVQWLTAGGGVQHAEMFPLLNRSGPNPLELFQIWLNLPRANKLVPAHFSMFWNESIPRYRASDPDGRLTEIMVIAGNLGDAKALPPPPKSWAAQAHADVAIWTGRMAPGARWTMPAATPGSHRVLYFFKGTALAANGTALPPSTAAQLRPDHDMLLENGPDETEWLLLQGRPIREPVVQHGPFVMNSREEIVQAFHDYQRTRFGGWPWESDDPVHGREGRFARHADGHVERPA